MADLGQAAAWHRQIEGLAIAADRAGVAPLELPLLRSRLFAQQTRFAEVAARTGAPLPALVPTPTEIAAAAASLGDMSTAVVNRALQSAASTLDAADAALATVQPASLVSAAANHPAGPPSQTTDSPAANAGGSAMLASAPPTVRNGLIYGAYALLVTLIQVILFVLLDEQSSLLAASPICMFVLPVFAWLAGYVTIGFIAPATGEAPQRSPRLGAIICAVPDLLLCGVLGALIALNIAQR